MCTNALKGDAVAMKERKRSDGRRERHGDCGRGSRDSRRTVKGRAGVSPSSIGVKLR
jgi:hypothetical protein